MESPSTSDTEPAPDLPILVTLLPSLVLLLRENALEKEWRSQPDLFGPPSSPREDFFFFPFLPPLPSAPSSPDSETALLTESVDLCLARLMSPASAPDCLRRSMVPRSSDSSESFFSAVMVSTCSLEVMLARLCSKAETTWALLASCDVRLATFLCSSSSSLFSAAISASVLASWPLW